MREKLIELVARLRFCKVAFELASKQDLPESVCSAYRLLAIERGHLASQLQDILDEFSESTKESEPDSPEECAK